MIAIYNHIYVYIIILSVNLWCVHFFVWFMLNINKTCIRKVHHTIFIKDTPHKWQSLKFFKYMFSNIFQANFQMKSKGDNTNIKLQIKAKIIKWLKGLVDSVEVHSGPLFIVNPSLLQFLWTPFSNLTTSRFLTGDCPKLQGTTLPNYVHSQWVASC